MLTLLMCHSLYSVGNNYQIPHYCSVKSIYSGVYHSEFNNETGEMQSALPYISYYKLKGPDHLIAGEAHKFNIDSHAIDAYFSFYSSEQYFIGDDKHRLGDSASKYIKFDKSGAASVWVERRSNNTICNAKELIVQTERPSVTNAKKKYTWSTSWLDVKNFQYSVDKLSKAALDNTVPVKITLMARNNTSGRHTILSKNLDSLSGTTSLGMRLRYNGFHIITLTLDDGTYQETIDLGTALKGDPINTIKPCSNCIPL